MEQGVHQYTWKTVESADFVEHLCSLVCEDVHKNLCVVQNNYREINNIVTSWSQDTYLDAFSSREKVRSYSIEELNVLHRYKYMLTWAIKKLLAELKEKLRLSTRDRLYEGRIAIFTG